MADLRPFDPSSSLESHLRDAFDACFAPSSPSICVGLSGGLDSIVLLYLLARLQAIRSFNLTACHIHHGLSPNANTWADFCQYQCNRLGIPLTQIRLDPLVTKQLGIEAAAREERYAAFFRLPDEVLALAHHQDDQIETFFLHLFRGTGLAGLKAMEVCQPFIKNGQEKILWRPLLGFSRNQLFTWAETHGLSWVEDESNADVQYRRNALRHQILPLIRQTWPGLSETIIATAQRTKESLALLNEIALEDAQKKEDFHSSFDLALLSQLSPLRGLNVLRYWLSSQFVRIPSESQFRELYRQLSLLSPQATGIQRFGSTQIGWYQGRIYCVNLPPFRHESILWQGESTLPWSPLKQTLRIKKERGKGISLSAITFQCPLLISNEYQQNSRLSIHPKRPRQKLKHIFQQAHIPPWERNRWPLLYLENQLIGIVGIGFNPAFEASADEWGILMEISSPPESI